MLAGGRAVTSPCPGLHAPARMQGSPPAALACHIISLTRGCQDRCLAVPNFGAAPPPLQGRRMIENSREVLAYLAARYPQARVHMFDFGKHPDMTMPEQVGAGHAGAAWMCQLACASLSWACRPAAASSLRHLHTLCAVRCTAASRLRTASSLRPQACPAPPAPRSCR